MRSAFVSLALARSASRAAEELNNRIQACNLTKPRRQNERSEIMEIGNLLFGNSRGKVQVPRTSAFEKPWQDLCQELKVNHYGFADEGCLVADNDGVLENEVFAIRSYDWHAECDCGATERLERLANDNPHLAACYQTVLDDSMRQYDERTGYQTIEQLFSGNERSQEGRSGTSHSLHSMFTPLPKETIEEWKNASELRDSFQDDLLRKLCSERGFTFPQGCMCHCDCGRDERVESKWREIGGHSQNCRLIQPNFLYKPTGFRINWYKYPFRDSYMTPGIKPREWRKIIEHCIDSVLSSKSPQGDGAISS